MAPRRGVPKRGGVREGSRHHERIDADRAKTGAVEVHELGERAVRAAHGVARRAQACLTGFPDLGEPFLAKEALQESAPAMAGTMLISVPLVSFVSRPSRKRTSSSPT